LRGNTLTSFSVVSAAAQCSEIAASATAASRAIPDDDMSPPPWIAVANSLTFVWLDNFHFTSVAGLLGAYRARRASPVEAVRTAFERIARIEPKINAFCVVADEREALRLAAESEARWREGRPLGDMDGVPISVKDAIIAKGWPTLRGSKTADAKPGDEDAPAVARLREAGAIILGKTTTPEFGWKGVTDSPLSGITRNPWNLALTPGGSSGGSAAALAAGIGHAALGTDAGGSVRIPASFCGLFAIKPTAGRVPNYPPSAVGTLGHIGPITFTAEDAALMLNLMAQPDGRDWLCLPPADTDYRVGLNRGVRGLRIAYSPTLGYAKVEREVADLVASSVKVFESLGAHIEEVKAPFEDPTDTFRVHFFAGIAHSTRLFSEAQLGLLDPGLSRVLEKARKVGLTEYMSAIDRRAALGRATRAFHEKYDLLVTPTMAVAPFEAGRLTPDGEGDDWTAWTPFTYPFNLTGQPAATVPCGFVRGERPVGLQLVGGMYQDALVLRAAQAFESARPQTRHPE
jgi:aspartyl-tRNA(Asn)/glutamyl-tRNA(Gln) amidotransferase subunit A